MQWVLLAVVVAALLFMSRFYPRVAFGLLAVLVVVAAVIVFSTTDVATINRSKLPAEHIEFENVVITPAYGGGFRFNARLKNTSESITLKEAALSITMLDCPLDLPEDSKEAEEKCPVIGQDEERIIVRIPPGQSRDVSRTLTFGSATPGGSVRWRVKITATRS